jgi:hypothetical protein
MSRKFLPAALAAAALAAALPSGASAAEALYGVTDDNRLVLMNSSGPQNPILDLPITGLVTGDRIVGLDTRPATDQLYALGATSRIYVINPATGAARVIGAGPFTPLLAGTQFGFDFNPTVDRIRVVSDQDQNLRLNPNNGNVANTDGNLAYAPGDPGAGMNPVADAAGYTNSLPTATETELFVIDTARDVLALQSPPNNGTLVTRGALGVDATGPATFDIATNNVAYATFRRPGAEGPVLHTINLQTGAATLTAGVRSALGRNVVALAAAGQLPADRTRPDVSVSLSSTQLESRLLAQNSVSPGVACDESCTITATLQRGGTSLGSATGSIVGAGKRLVKVPLSATARSVIRRPGTELFSLRVDVVDAAGNTFTTTRQFRTRLG